MAAGKVRRRVTRRDRAKTLDCILDDCPKTGDGVDYRDCERCPECVGRGGVGKVRCAHQRARHDPKPERWEVIKASAGVQHVLLCGPKRGGRP